MKRYAVIECEDSPKWVDGFSAIMLPAFREGGDGDEVWDVFKTAVDGSLPSPDDKYDGIVVTGSHYNVRDNVAFQDALVAYLRAVLVPAGGDEAGKPRVVGICYGHQVIAHALGGRVDFNPGKRFFLKSERLVPTPMLATQPFAADFVAAQPRGGEGGGVCVRVRHVHDALVCPASSSEQVLAAAKDAEWGAHLGLLESHGDCVAELPPCGVLLASSSSCAHELVLCGANMLTIQGHPEFDFQSCIAEKIWPAVVDTNKRLSDEEVAEARASFAQPRHSRLVLEMLRRFLKRRG